MVAGELETSRLEKPVDPTSDSTSEEEEFQGCTQAKVPRLLAKYRNRRHKGIKVDDYKQQLHSYLQDTRDPDLASTYDGNALHFWDTKKIKYPALHHLALRVLAIPASSAPVERVFSRGGLIMRPHRARLSSDNLAKLIFLKCNEDML